VIAAPKRLRRTTASTRPAPAWPAALLPLGTLRALRRVICVLAWTMVAVPVQAVLLLFAGGRMGRGKVVFARIFWAGVCRLLGLQVRLIGAPVPAGRPVLFVSNHSSWLDIPALGGRLEGCFIAKEQVGRWPLIATVARLGRTVFVSRKTTATARERGDLAARLAAGDNLFLFPEGTTSDGSRVMPFRSSFLALAEGPNPPAIQPVSVVYDRLSFLPARRASQPLFAWFGDMDLASHVWRIGRQRGMRVTIWLHEPLDATLFPDRKALTQAVWQIVADGAARLRQNRPSPPGAAPQPSSTRA